MPVQHRPNIVFCLFDSLSSFDSALLESANSLPAFSALREQSALFTNVYAPCPESSPARASVFTGLDPCVHGLWTNGVALAENEQTFVQILAQAGYTNWLVGRRQLAGMSNWTTEFIPADEFAAAHWAHGPLHRSRQNAYLIWLQQQTPEHYRSIFATQADPDDTLIRQEQLKALAELPDNLSFNYWVGQRVVDLVSSHEADQPFLAVAGFSVSSSYGAQSTHEHDGELVSQQALQQADTALGAILNHLETNNLADDTVVIVTAGRGNWQANGTKDVASATDAILSERAITVPLLIRRPGFKHQVESAPVSTLDIAPTILDTANLATKPRMQGTSLLNVLDQSDAPRGWAMSRFRRGDVSLASGNWQTALRMKEMKLVVTHGNTHEATQATYELYNLEVDPMECHNLANQPSCADILENMIDMMIDARCALEDRTEPRIADF